VDARKVFRKEFRHERTRFSFTTPALDEGKIGEKMTAVITLSKPLKQMRERGTTQRISNFGGRGNERGSRIFLGGGSWIEEAKLGR